MYILKSYSAAVLACLITMLCWGSWANTQKLTSRRWRFELFYWDYAAGVFLFSILSALTLGSLGSAGRPFQPDLLQALPQNMLSAIAGGFVFNIANILLVAAIAVAGMAVAFPVGIGIALVLGVIVNYMASPVGNATLLFGGVALVAAAILLDARAYQRLSKHTAQVPAKGILLSIISGVLMGSFYRFVASAMTTDFTQPEQGKLGPYAAVALFCFGIFISSFLFVPVLMRKPVSGTPVTIRDYFKGTLRDHQMGLLGGAIWCLGMSLSILAAEKAGFAISYGLGQGATMVAALWGILAWKEFNNAPVGTSKLLTLMMLAYLMGLGLIIAARLYA